MSGPVILSAQQLRMRAEAEERLRLVQDQYRKSEALKREMYRIEDVQKLLAQIAEDKQAAEISRKLSELTRQCRRAADRRDSVNAAGNNGELKRYNDELDRLRETVHPRIAALAGEAEKARDVCVKKFLQSAAAPVREVRTQAGREITVFAPPELPAETVRAEKERLLDLIRNMEERADRIKALRDADFNALRAKIKAAAGSGKRENRMIYQDLHQTDVMEIQPLLRKLENAEEDFDRLDQELSRELAAYHAVCAEYGAAPKAFAFRPSSVQEIRYATAELLRERCRAANCAEVIARVRKILSGMGYTYIGEKEEDRQVVRHIYRIHDRTILHVIFDSTGRVTMEVAIESDDDRAPSGRETEQIVSDQGTFCSGFGQLLAQLNSGGLHMRQDMLCPGGAEYAQVINTSGFTKEAETQAPFDYSIYETPANKYLEMR